MYSAQIIPREKIDIQKWDNAVNADRDASPYMYSYYLDATCENWSAIIFGDYISFIPICWNKKWGIKYAYQPPFLQRMEIVGDKNDISLQKQVCKIVNKHFSYVDFKTSFFAEEATTRKNYILHLNRPYEIIASTYSSQTKKNLKNKDLEIKEIQDIDLVLEQYQIHTIPKVENWKKVFEEKQKKILIALRENDLINMYGAYYKNELIASNAIINHHHRIILLMSSSSEKGRELSGFSAIVDDIIRSNAGREVILDFEGSEIPGIAKFNEGFGAELELYYHWKWINWFWK